MKPKSLAQKLAKPEGTLDLNVRSLPFLTRLRIALKLLFGRSEQLRINPIATRQAVLDSVAL
jgi:hypothetical protein